MARSSRSSHHRDASMVLEGHNYWLILVGIALLVVGYVIMRIDNQVHGVLSLYVAPFFILGGYLEVIYAILWHPSRPTDEDRSQP